MTITHDDHRNELVRQALERLEAGLAPFVLQSLKARYGASWWVEGVVARKDPRDITRIVEKAGSRWQTLSDEERIATLDHRSLLGLMARAWVEGFAGRLPPPARSYLEECRFIANRQAHLATGDPWTLADAARALDTIRRLLRLCGAAGDADVVQQLGAEVEQEATSSSGRVLEATPDAWGEHGLKRPPGGVEETVAGTVQLPLRSAWGFARARGLEQESEVIHAAQAPGRVHKPLYRRARFARLFHERGLLSDFIAERWPYGATEKGQRLLAGYDRLLRRCDPGAPISTAAARSSWDSIEQLIGAVEGPEDFAIEHDRYLYGDRKRDPSAG